MIKRVPHNFKLVEVIAPPSKSYAQRAILAASLCDAETKIRYPGESDDVLKAISLAQTLGAQCKLENNILVIKPGINAVGNEFNCGESGLGCRLITSLAAVLNEKSIINGKRSLLKRSMKDFEEILPQLGLECKTNNGCLPLEIKGKAKGGKLKIDGSSGSQYLSGLLMALPLLKEDSEIEVSNLKSIPYIDITIELLASFGVRIEREGNNFYSISGAQKYVSPSEFSVEGDWSGASFWIVLASIYDGIKIRGLNAESLQADIAILDAIAQVGANFSWEYDKLSIQPDELNPFEFDATHCPDLFPPLVVLAAAVKGRSIIKGVSRLGSKESKRGKVLQKEFRKLGLNIEIEGDDMIISGTGELEGGTINANNDHRIAMAGAIAARLTRTGAIIEDAGSVAKSYPDFWDVIGY